MLNEYLDAEDDVAEGVNVMLRSTEVTKPSGVTSVMRFRWLVTSFSYHHSFSLKLIKTRSIGTMNGR